MGSAPGIRSNLMLEVRQRKATTSGSGCCENHPEGEKWGSCPLSPLEPSQGSAIALSSEMLWEERPILRPGWKNWVGVGGLGGLFRFCYYGLNVTGAGDSERSWRGGL